MLEDAIDTLTVEIRKLKEAVLAQNALFAGRTHAPVPGATASTASAAPPRVAPLDDEALEEKATAKLLGEYRGDRSAAATTSDQIHKLVEERWGEYGLGPSGERTIRRHFDAENDGP